MANLREARGVRGAILGRDRPFRLRRYEVSGALAPYVRNAWFIDWCFPEGAGHTQRVLAPAGVNLTVQPDQDTLTGPHDRALDQHISGTSAVWGVLFRPAGFGAVVGPRVHEYADMRAPIGEHLSSVEGLRASLQAANSDAQALGALEAWLRPQIRAHDETRRALAGRVVEAIAGDRGLHRVDQLTERFEMSERALQRLMRQWVGLTPKSLLIRYRLHEAVHKLTHDEVDLVALAYDLGYADQPHFIRDFRRIVGRTPGDYRRECRAARAAEKSS